MTSTLRRSYRNFVKNKFFSSLNVFGLTTGVAVFLLIALYVKFETGYEDFNPQASHIYRVALKTYKNNELVRSTAENFPTVGPALQSSLSEVIGNARLYNMGYKNNVIITNEDAQPDPIALKQRKFLYADASFLPMMGYTLAQGDVQTALKEPYTAVLTPACAALYFGNQNPIGKTLRLRDDDNNNELVKVTGILKEAPINTHLKFDILFSYSTLFGRQGDDPDYGVRRYDLSWSRSDMYTFIQVQPGTDLKALEVKLPLIISKHNPLLKESNQNYILSLQALPDIHLYSSLADEPEANGDWRIVRFLGMIGIFIIVIAWINYVNLSTAKAMEQAKEVGVRKVLGAFRIQLVRQYMLEAALVNFVSAIVAVAAVSAILPAFNTLSGLSLSMGYLLQPWFFCTVIILWAVGTILSGFYPAIVLSSFKPIAILKGKLKNSTQGILLRKSLVVFQFTASVVLIAGTLIVYKQLNHMMSQDIGMNIDQVLVVERPGIRPSREEANLAVDAFRHELKKDPSIQAVSASTVVPGMQRQWKSLVKKYAAPDQELVTMRFNSMDFEFMDVFKMKLLAGRMFSEKHVEDPDTSVIITESASRLLGFVNPEDAVGQTVNAPELNWTVIIIGVVNDYHQESLKTATDPIIFEFSQYNGEFYSMRVNTNNVSHTINHIKAAYESAFPGNPFDYFFLDDYFNRQYKNERQFGLLFTTFAGLALFIGCLGLLGLSAYTAIQRTKEIGVRKVLGSSEAGIFVLLSKEYIKLVMFSIALGMPVVYFLMDTWIQSFAYRTSLDAPIFIGAGTLVLLIALLTVSIQTLRAARTNPVDSLRYE